MNFKPEKAGKTQVPRCDVSLAFLVRDMEIDEFVSASGNPLKLLWDAEGNPQFSDLEPLQFLFQSRGIATIGPHTGEDGAEFDDAILKKVVVEPLLNREAAVRCQVRVDPITHSEELVELSVKRQCSFSFNGNNDDAADAGKQDGLDV